MESMKTILSMSISGGVMIAALLLLKPLLKEKLSKSWQYYIWLLVILRLLMPISMEASVMNRSFAEAPIVVEQQLQIPQQPQTVITEPSAPQVVPETPTAKPENTIPLETVPIAPPIEKPAIDWRDIAKQALNYSGLLWAVVAAGLFVRKIFIYQRFVRHVRRSWIPVSETELLDHVALLAQRLEIKKAIDLCISPAISTPMLIGFTKPRVLLPQTAISQSELEYTILHELTHYKRKDMLYKWLVQLTLCLHWFNPLVYLMEKEISRCCELACDEAVIKNLDGSGKRAYGDTLINAAGKKNLGSDLASVTLSESGELLKERLLAILHYRKMSKRLLALALALTLLLTACGTVLGAYVKREKAEESTVEEIPEMPTEITQKYPVEQEEETDNKIYLDYLLRSGWHWKSFNVSEGIDWQSYGDWSWFGFIADHEMDYVVDEDGFIWCKQEEIEKALEEHLDFDAKELRTKTKYYDAKKKMYRIPEGWDPGLVWYALLDSRQEGNLLYIESALYDATRGDAVMGTALTTVRLEDDGWKVLSNTFPHKTAEELFRERISFENFRFHSEEPGVTEIVLDGIESYYEQFMGETVPESMRIDSLEISNLKEVGFGKNESLYRADIAYHTSSPYWYTGVGVPREDGSYDCLIESQGFRFKSLNDGNHIITDIGQGGMMDGLYLLDENEDPIYEKIDVSLYQYGQHVQTVSITEKWQIRNLLYDTLYSEGEGELRSESDFEEMHEYVVVNIDGHDPFYFFADKGRELSYGDGTTTLYPYSHPYYRQSGNRCDQIGGGWFLSVYELTDGESNYRMNLEELGGVILTFSNIDFVPEFSRANVGDIHHNELTNQLEVGVLRSVGSTTGAMDGPSLNYVVDLNTDTVVSKEYTKFEIPEIFNHGIPDDGTMETMSDERLVEVAKQLHTLLKSYRLPLLTQNLKDEESLAMYNITMSAPNDQLISHGSYVTTDDITILEICSVAETQEKLLVKPKELFDVVEQYDRTFGKWRGEAYHIRWTIEQGGVSGYQHELHYFLTDGTYWVYAAGYPLYGNGGVGTQVERFEQCLSTLEVTPSQPVPEKPINTDRLKELPVVTGPDENGYFPLISEALWNQHVIHSDERAIMPTTAILPFMENEDCRKLLSSIYSGSQLEVLYEHRSYTLVEDMYDPYRYEYRDQYVPTWVVVLKVENCRIFDRVVIAARQEYSAWKFRDSNREILGMKSKQYWDEVHSTGWEADWNLGDCIGLTPAFGVKANWHPSLWFQDKKRGLLLDNDNIQAALPVSDTNAILSSVYSYADLGEYIQPPQGKEQDKLVSTANGIAYYSVKDKRLSAFENSSGKEYFLNNERIFSLGYYSAELYDLSAENAPKLLMNSAEWGANLYFADGYGSDWAEEHFALMYYKESEQRWNAVIFDADGKVLHHIPTELSAIMTESTGVPLYNIMDISLSEGRISFNYYPDGQGSGTWEQYAIDTKVSDELLKIR